MNDQAVRINRAIEAVEQVVYVDLPDLLDTHDGGDLQTAMQFAAWLDSKAGQVRTIVMDARSVAATG